MIHTHLLRHSVVSFFKKYVKKNHALFSVAALLAVFVGLFFIARGVTPQSSELAFIEHSSFGQNGGSVVPASCDSGNPFATSVVGESIQLPGSHSYGDCVTACPNGGGVYDPYFDPSASACPAPTPAPTTPPKNPPQTPPTKKRF